MEEMRFGEYQLMEYIITKPDGTQIRMMLDADSYKDIEHVVKVLANSTAFDRICSYGQKDVRCIGA